MDHPRTAVVHDLLGQTLAADPRRRVEAVRALQVALGDGGGAGAPGGGGDGQAERTLTEGWDRVLELVSDPDRDVRRTVLHAIAGGAPADRVDDVTRALDRLSQDEDASLRTRARKVQGRFRRARAA